MKAYTGPDSYAFLSYSRKDTDRIRPLIDRLQMAGCRIWYDEGIHNSSEWTEIIADRLANTSLLFVVISKNSVESKYVKREIKYAEGKDIPILPFYIEDVKLPSELEFLIGTMQSVFSKWDLETDFRAVYPDFPKDIPGAQSFQNWSYGRPGGNPGGQPFGGGTNGAQFAGNPNPQPGWNGAPVSPPPGKVKKKKHPILRFFVVLLIGFCIVGVCVGISESRNSGSDSGGFYSSTTKKQYTKAGITLTLPNDFTEYQEYGFDYALRSDDVYIYVDKTDSAEMASMGYSVSDFSPYDFASLIIENKDFRVKPTISTSDGLISYNYEWETDGDIYYYYIVVYKRNSTFWVVNFVCKAKDRYTKQPEFVEYAKSVVVS